MRNRNPTHLGFVIIASLLLLGLAFVVVTTAKKLTQLSGFRNRTDVGAFLIISDIHFDPFADPALVPKLISADVDQWESIFASSSTGGYSQYGSDTSYPLLKSVLETAGEYGKKAHYDYVVVTGDYLTHDFQQKYKNNHGNRVAYPDFVLKTMIFTSRTIQQAFPALPVFGSLGNNDSICGDYNLSPGGRFLAKVADEWRVLASVPEAKSDFATGGFYVAPHPTLPQHEFIVLDTTFWSTHYKDACSPSSSAPGTAELDWLAWKLYQAQLGKKTVSLIMHIPPGIDAFASVKSAQCGQVKSLWDPGYLSTFLKLMEKHRGLLRDMYAGHLHMDDFRILQDSKRDAFLEGHLVPAVSPVYGNNPAFEVGHYDKRNGDLTDYTIVYLTNLSDLKRIDGAVPLWSTEYSVRAGYHLLEYGPKGASTIAERIRLDPETRNRYVEWFNVNNSVSPPTARENWLAYACAQTELTVDDFQRCACNVPSR